MQVPGRLSRRDEDAGFRQTGSDIP
jgi:hypothetical protein